jgi:predicted Holliday junction resolvase-like endonuclease
VHATGIIQTLVSARFYADCPCCGETILLKDAGLFYLDDFSPAAADIYSGLLDSLKERRKELLESRKGITQSSLVTTKAVNLGLILERVAPMMTGFGLDHNDCRALFDPIDYIAFEGLRVNGKVSRIVFLDIKTGSAKLSPRQKAIKELVEEKKVEMETYTERSST